MTKTLTVTEAVRRFSDVVGEVRFLGTEVTLTKGGKPVAVLGPARRAARRVRLRDLPALFEGLPRLAPGDAAAFGRDLASIRRSAGKAPGKSPWDS